MKQNSPARLPRMRTKGLIVDKLPDEVLVYDTDHHKAHCLNRSAALIWEQCDGRSRVSEIAHRVQTKLAEPFSEELVWLALGQLNKNNLLDQPPDFPPQLAGLSRRKMIHALGIAAVVALPVITSIVSPTAVQAATCLPKNAACSTSSQCCSHLCNTQSGKCQ